MDMYANLGDDEAILWGFEWALILTRIQTVTAHRRQELLCLSVFLGGLSADYICRPQ